MIDLNKQYRTEEGCEVKLSFIDRDEVYGHYKSKWDCWVAVKWSVDGGIYLTGFNANLNLVEVKPRIKRTVWVNLYNNCTSSHSTKKIADTNDCSCGRADFNDRGGVRLACVKVKIDCEEGEGL
jgi:hypothetical protein